MTGFLENGRNIKQYSQTSVHVQQSIVQSRVTNRPGTSGLAGIADKTLIQFLRLLSLTLYNLSKLFEKGLQYRTIKFVHPRICTLGVFKQRPKQACYKFLWDVEIVLVYLKSNISDNSQLSDKDLTYKLTVLMAFSSASRALSMQHLKIKFMAANDMSNKFYFHKRYKSWRRFKAPPTVSYQAYT